MELRRYRTASVAEGFLKARAELGPQALVLEARTVNRSAWLPWIGGREVEVTAATGGGLSAGRRSVPEIETDVTPRRDPATQELVARLEASGFDRPLAFEVATAIPLWRRRGSAIGTIHAVLSERLATLAAPPERETPASQSDALADDRGEVLVFIGPPGVGKTTTIAKMAARERARGGTRYGLIGADGYRVGAVEQLRLYADIIQAPFVTVRSIGELERVLAKRRRPVLVDTAGRAPDDRASRELFACLSTRGDVRTHLVVDAGQATHLVERTLEHYRDACPDRLVLTKLDQVHSLAPLIGVLRRAGIPVAHLGIGQRVPDDLMTATASSLAWAALGETPKQAA